MHVGVRMECSTLGQRAASSMQALCAMRMRMCTHASVIPRSLVLTRSLTG